MYGQWAGALVLTLAGTAAPVWASTTSEHERLAYHHVRPGTVDCCMDAVIDLYTDTKSPIRWMPFLGTSGWATYDCNTGTWTVDETTLRQKLANVRDDVAAAGYLMLDWEAYADYPNPGDCVGCPCDPDTLPAQNVQDRIARMKEAADIASAWLDDEFEPGHGIRFGFYRIPDHKHPEQQTGNAYVDVLSHTNTILSRCTATALRSNALAMPAGSAATTTASGGATSAALNATHLATASSRISSAPVVTAPASVLNLRASPTATVAEPAPTATMTAATRSPRHTSDSPGSTSSSPAAS